MAISSDKSKLKLLAYNSNSELEPSVITKATSFDITGNYIIMVNKAIPKNSKSYIEFEVNECDMTEDIRHIPLMVGISKEQSWGFLNSDYCFGAVYYTRNSWAPNINQTDYLGFRISEKYAGYEAINTFFYNIQSRPPVKHSTIGIGVDMPNNNISIFIDGKFFYGFNPSQFNINDEANVYFAICSLEPNKHISGSFRFSQPFSKEIPHTFDYGKIVRLDDGTDVIDITETKETYSPFYNEIFVIENAIHIDLEATIKTGQRYLNSSYNKILMNCFLSAENSLAPINIEQHRRDLDIVYIRDTMRHFKDIHSEIINKHAFKYNPRSENPDYAYINYPLDKYYKLYFEITCLGAQLINDYKGIPLSIGITKDPTFLSQKSLKLNLFHLRTDGYHILQYKDGFEYLKGDYNIQNPVYPNQPTTIGVLTDLYNNTIEIYIEGILFTRIISDTDISDFSLADETTYMYFEAAPEYVFNSTGYVICNFGTKETKDFSYIDDPFLFFNFENERNVKGLWEYYNMIMKEIWYNGKDRDVDILSHIKVISDKLIYGKNIFARIIVPESDPEILKWTPGLNKIWKTFNTISNTEEANNIPDKTVYDLRRMIDEDDNER